MVTVMAPVGIGLADTSSHRHCLGSQGDTHRLGTLVSSAAACLALEVGLGLLVGTVAADGREDLDIGDLAQAATVDLGLQLSDNLLNSNSGVSSTALAEEPFGDGSAVEHSTVELLVLGLILVGTLLRLLLVLQSLLLSLANGKRPAVHHACLASSLVLIAPLLNSGDLLLNKIDLELRVLMGIAVTASLVVLAAEMNPNVGGNHAGAELVATKDMRDGLTRLRSSVAVFDVHTLDLVAAGHGRGRIRRRHTVGLLLLRWKRRGF